MLNVTNKVLACWDGKYRERMATSHIVIHRIEPDIGDAAEDFSDAFKKTDKYAAGSYTGGEFPYHFLCFKDGRVEQCLAVMDVGPHARVWNSRAIAIAVVGNFHLLETPTLEQWTSAVNLAALLAWWMGAYQINGHTELGASATKDALKRCPGAGFPMDDFRSAVTNRLREVTPEYNQMAKNLVLCCREVAGCKRGGYGIVINAIGGLTG